MRVRRRALQAPSSCCMSASASARVSGAMPPSQGLHLRSASVAHGLLARARSGAPRSCSTSSWNSSAMRSPLSVTVFCAVLVHRRHRALAGAGQADADVGVLALARAVDDAAHDRDRHLLDAGVFAPPLRHAVRGYGSGCAARVPGSRCWWCARSPGRRPPCGVKARSPMVCRISCATITSWVRSPSGSGRERDADGVADALLQQHRHAGGGGDDALGAHAGLGEAQVQRVVAAARQVAIDGDQVLHAAHLGREDDARVRQSEFLGARVHS